MKDQYGSKRGEQVFYASKNKGKIKGVEKKKNGGLGEKSGPPPKKGPSSQGIKVLKLRGGGMDMGNAANQAQSAAMGNSGSTSGGNTNSGRDLDYQQRGMSKSDYAKSTQTQNFGGRDTKTPPSTTKSTLNIPPVTPFGLAIHGMKMIENARRAKRAKGEFVFTNKKVLPITRDFYKVEGRPLNTKIGSPDEPYMKEAGIIGFKPPKDLKNSGPDPKVILCPDGSMPPCVDTTKAKPVTPGGRNPVTPYKFNFEYRDGGLVRGSGKVLKGKVKKARIY